MQTCIKYPECLPLDPAAEVRFPPRAVGIFLHPVTFGGQCGGECHGVRYITLLLPCGRRRL